MNGISGRIYHFLARDNNAQELISENIGKPVDVVADELYGYALELFNGDTDALDEILSEERRWFNVPKLAKPEDRDAWKDWVYFVLALAEMPLIAEAMIFDQLHNDPGEMIAEWDPRFDSNDQ